MSHPRNPAAHDRAEELLAQRARSDDEGRRTRLLHEAVLLTMDLPETVARRFANHGIEIDDLLQVARLALVKAAHGYDPERESNFAAYAVPTITGELKRHFRDHAWALRPPRRLQELRAQVIREEDRLRQALRREPTTTEIASSLSLACAQVREALQCSAA